MDAGYRRRGLGGSGLRDLKIFWTFVIRVFLRFENLEVKYCKPGSAGPLHSAFQGVGVRV